MSAFVVDKDTIDLLVAAAARVFELKGETLEPHAADRLGQQLWDENVRSVAYRYSGAGRTVCYGADFAERTPDTDTWDLPGTYTRETIAPGIELDVPQWKTPYTYAPAEISREALEDATKSYRYQSCEHPEWEDSFAATFAEKLLAALGEFPPAPEPERPAGPTPEQLLELYGDLSRAETIKRIRQALRRRSGKTWSVTGGRGTAYGWIRIDAPPARRTGKHVARPGGEIGDYDHVDTGEPQEYGIMTPQDCVELAELLGKDRPIHPQGESIPSGNGYYREYIDRAEGREIREYGKQYWD